MEALAASFGLSVAMLVLVALTLAALFPLFWVWMLVDSVIRDGNGYPSKDPAEKVVWILLLVFIQPAAVIYFFMVWNAARTRNGCPSAAVVA